MDPINFKLAFLSFAKFDKAFIYTIKNMLLKNRKMPKHFIIIFLLILKLLLLLLLILLLFMFMYPLRVQTLLRNI